MQEPDIHLLLKELCCAAGVNGLSDIQTVACDWLKKFADDVRVDVSGNVLATLPCGKEKAKRVLLEAHMDEIGFVVTGFTDGGFVRVAPCGGIDLRCIAAAPVKIFGKETVNGVFCAVPPHLRGDDDGKKCAPADKLFVDVGMKDPESLIAVGDRVSFMPCYATLSDTTVTAKALDDRAGMAAVLYALSLLQERDLPCDVEVLFACGEELGSRGATPAAFAVDADAAVITDVSFAFTPDAPRESCGDLGKGAMIGFSPILNGQFSKRLMQYAKDNGIAFQTEVMGGKTGTDADAVTVAGNGTPSALISIPQRYMHTPIEVVDVRDIAAVGTLMAAFITEEMYGI